MINTVVITNNIINLFFFFFYQINNIINCAYWDISFTMGGAPFVMETNDITLGDYEYKQYKSGAVYNTGATVNIKAS